MSVDDIILWQSFTNGDRSSFEAIYRRHFDMLYEYGMRRAGDEALVRDSIQDLFIKLWTNRSNFRNTDNIRFYLLTSLKNTLLNMQARQHKEKPAGSPDQFLLFFPAPHEPGIDDLEQTALRQARLTDALNQLSPRQKEVIWLRYFDDMDYEQIASLLDISVGGVYKLHYRALDSLKEILRISHRDLLLLLLVAGHEYITHYY